MNARDPEAFQPRSSSIVSLDFLLHMTQQFVTVQMKKSLHIMTSTACGGLELYVSTLVSEMARAGNSVAIVVSPETRYLDMLVSAGVVVHFAHSHQKLDPRDIRLIRSLVHEGHRIVHSHTRVDVWKASIALMATRRAQHVHSVYMVVAPKRDLIHRMIYGRVDAILSSSTHTNERIAECFPIPTDRIHLVRYGRNLSEYTAQPSARAVLRTKLGIPQDASVFGMIGRIDVQKGTREFVESIAMLPERLRNRTHYVIIGEPTVHGHDADGTPRYEPQAIELDRWMKTFIANEGLADRVHVLPFTSDILPYYGMLDALVLASYAEMYSLSVIDAMAMGIPVIGTNTEGTPEQVADGIRGWLVEPRSPQAIADAIARYVESPELANRHGANARTWARTEHDFSRTLQNIGSIYDVVLNEDPARRRTPGARPAIHVSAERFVPAVEAEVLAG